MASSAKSAFAPLDRLAADGVEVEVLDLPQATHAFDDDRASDPRTTYRPDLEAQATAFDVAALQRMAGAPAADGGAAALPGAPSRAKPPPPA